MAVNPQSLRMVPPLAGLLVIIALCGCSHRVAVMQTAPSLLRVIVFGDAASIFRAGSSPIASDETTVRFPAFVRHYRFVLGGEPVSLGINRHHRIDLIAVPFHS